MSPMGTVSTAAAGSADAFARLVQDEQARVYHFLLKRLGHVDDAAELTQETFLHAHRAWGTFRGESKASTWLLGIALNLARNHVARSPWKRWTHLSDDILDDMAGPQADPEHCAANRRLVYRLAEAMEALPPDMRAVFSLVCLEGIAYEDAARALGIPTGTVRSRIARTRAALRRAMEGEHRPEPCAVEESARAG